MCDQRAREQDARNLRFVDVDAGVFHAAAVTESGECLCWGKHGAALPTGTAPASESARETSEEIGPGIVAREAMGVLIWRPADGAGIVEVACG